MAWQMARKPPEAQDKIDSLVKMYEVIGAGKDGLKQEFSKQWDKLPENKRAQLVDRLLKMGLLPHEVGYALEVFQGKVVSIV